MPYVRRRAWPGSFSAYSTLADALTEHEIRVLKAPLLKQRAALRDYTVDYLLRLYQRGLELGVLLFGQSGPSHCIAGLNFH